MTVRFCEAGREHCGKLILDDYCRAPCWNAPDDRSAVPAPALDYPALADRLVRHMALQPGEKVLLLSYPGQFEPLVPLLRQGVIRAGGIDLGSWQVLAEAPPGLDPAAVAKSAAGSRAALLPLLRNVDLAVMLPGASPGDPEYAAMQEVLREGRGRTIHFHWAFARRPGLGAERQADGAVTACYH